MVQSKKVEGEVFKVGCLGKLMEIMKKQVMVEF